jgi:predicted DNA-binding protein
MEKKTKSRKYTKLLQILITPELDGKIRKLADKMGLRYSEIVRMAIIEYIEKIQNKGRGI